LSQIVQVTTQVRDPDAAALACRRLGLDAPVHGTAQLYSGTATGLLVSLPGWCYPAVFDTATCAVHFDDFAGAWVR
jgi:hypothetical protein